MKDVFVAVDTDRLTNGTTDVNTKSLSSWLENRVDRNNRCLVSNSHCVATSKPNGLSTRYNTRYYASLIPTCIHVGVYDLPENTSRINAEVLGLAMNGNVEMWMEVHVFRGGNVSSVIQFTDPLLFSTSDLQISHTLEIDPKELTTSKCIVSIWVKSFQTTISSLQLRNRGQVLWTDYQKTSHDGFREASGWNAWEADNIIKDVDSGRTWQLIKYFNVTGKGGSLDGVWWGIQPLDGKRINTDEWPSGNTLEKHRISRFYHYSTYISFERNPDKSTFSYSAKSPYTMLAQTPVLGQHTSQHAFNLDYEHATYRMQHVGNNITINTNGSWPIENAKPLWISTRGGVSPVSEVLVNSVGCNAEWNKTRIEVSGLMLGVEVNALWTGDTDKMGYPPAINRIEEFSALGADDPRRFAAPQAGDSVQRIKGSIPAKLRLRQFATGNTDLAFTTYNHEINFDLDITYWRATPDHSRPLLRGLSFAYHGDVFTNSRKDIKGTFFGFEGWRINEGWLQNLNGHSDMQYLTPFTITMDPPAGYDSNRPLVAQLLIGPNDKTNYFSTVSEPVSVGVDADGHAKFEDTRMFTHLVTWSVATRGVLDNE
jgi:hypothetical protein